MALNLKDVLIEEIALEGLDGITINTLWTRLNERPNFSFSLDDSSKQYLWRCVLDLKGIEFYILKEERPDLVTYNRFHYIDPETKQYLETEHIPDDIYPIKIINEDGVLGSCSTYKTRRNVTKEIRNKKLTLGDVTEQYGSKLVIVASQAIRQETIIGRENDPDFEFDAFGFCILERIARTRYNGEASAGKLSLQDFKESPKTMFYMLKKLKSLKVWRKQRLIVINKKTNTKLNCFLYHINRFYKEVGNRLNHELMNLAQYLSEKPECMEEVFKTKTDLKLFDVFKKLAQHTMYNGDRYFEFIDVPWREKYPDAKPKDYLMKNHRQEKKIRHIRLIPTLNEVTKSIKTQAEKEFEDDEDEEEEVETDDAGTKLKYDSVFDEPNLYQVMKLINESGKKGVSHVDLQRLMSAPRLAVRRILVFLQRTNYVTTMLEDRGRQKVILYLDKRNVNQTTAQQTVKLEMQKFQSISMEPIGSDSAKEPDKTPDVTDSTNIQSASSKSRKKAKKEMPKITFNEEKPSDDKVFEIQRELKRLEENQLVTFSPAKLAVKREIMKEMTQDAGVKVVIEELIPEKVTDKKTGRVINGMERFGSMLTESHIRRANWMLEVINAIKIVENFRLLKLLRNREKEINLSINMDQKSLKRLVYALCEEGKMKSYKAIITMDERTKEFTYLCTPTTSSEDETLFRMIDEAKLRYFSVSQEELRNRSLQKKLLAKAEKERKEKEKKAPPVRKDIPQSALETIKSHQEYRKKLAEKAPTMIYDRRAGMRYGLLPKMLRIQAAHQYLFYLCYVTFGHPLKTSSKPKPTHTDNSSSSAVEAKQSSDAKTSENDDKNMVSNVEAANDKTTDDKDADVDDAGDIKTKCESKPEKQPIHDAGDEKEKCESKPEKQPIDDAGDKKEKCESKPEKQPSEDAGDKKEKCESKPEKQPSEDRVDKIEGKTPQVENEPVVYCDEMTWRRYLPPVPVHAGYPKGWVLVSDCLLNMPVCLFCEIVNVCYKIDGLEEILEHPQKRLYPVINLPFSLTQQLLHSKKYVQSFSTCCCYMAEMGLLSFGKEVLKEKDQMFIYLHQNASILDTKQSLKGYNKTKAPEGHVFPEKHFHFETLSDLRTYWEILQITAVNSNLGCKSMVLSDLEDEVSYEVKSLKQASASFLPNSVEDNGVLPGDRRGGAGIDSSLFAHTLKNWTNSGVLKPQRKYRKINSAVGLKAGLDLESKREVVDQFNKNRLKGKERLVLSDDPNKPVALKKVTRVVSGNKGGKGVLRRVHTELTKTHKIISRMEGKLMKKRCIKIQERVKKKKKPYEKGDEKDRTIYQDRCKMRVVWSLKEDSVLLMCRLASLIMDNKKKTSLISYIKIRDYLHDKCGSVAYDKTSQAVQRRIKFVLKNPQTETNLLLYYREAMQDEFVLTNYVSKEFFMTDIDLESKFRKLVEYLLDKFKSLDLQKCSLPDDLEDLRQNYTIQYIGKLQPRKIYTDVKNKTDICRDVLRNILHSAVLLHDKQGRTHEMFKLLTQYPDALLSAVVRELRNDGLFVINKKNYQKESVNQLQTGMGLRNFKVSQRYLYQFKHRYLSAMFEESAKLVTDLCDKHVHGNGEDETLTLPFHPSSGECASLFPLILNRWLDFKITMPQELVIVDMEGFYKFPWGRGKNSSSQTKGDKMLQDIKLPQTSKHNLTKSPDEESKLDKESEGKTSKDLDGAMSNISETAEDAMDVNIVAAKSSLSDKEVEKEIVSKMSENEILNEKNEDEKDLNKGSSGSDAVLETSKEGEKDLSKDSSGSGEVLKANKDDKDKQKGDLNSGNTLICSNHTTVIIPDLDQQLSGELPGTVSGIASRTLLSLRRAEDCSFEEIRIFNAQDNFVVNSCEIGIKIRKNLEEGKGGNPLVIRDENKDTGKETDGNDSASIQKTVDDKIEGRNDSELDELLMKEKMANLSQLLLDKARILRIYRDLQKLIPFQINIQEIWDGFKERGTSAEDLNLYKRVYGEIDSHGEIGIRFYDLKRVFIDVPLWREAVDVLIHQNTVVKVGVTCTRFVSLQNARPWVIHAYRNIKGRGLHVDKDPGNTLPTEENNECETETLQQNEQPSLYTEPGKETAATLKGLGDDRISLDQDTKESPPVSQSIDRPSPKKRKIDTENETEPKDGKQSCPSDVTDTDNSTEVSKRKLSLTINDEMTRELKKRKLCETSESMEEDTEGKQKESAVNLDTHSTSEHDEAIKHFRKETDNDNVSTDNVVNSNQDKQAEIHKDHQEDIEANEIDNAKQEDSLKTRKIRKRKLPEDAESKQDEEFIVSSYDKVRLVIQPWRKPEGGINKPILKMMLESVMLYLMMNPGSPEDELVKRYAPYLQPNMLRNIVDVLEDIGCVSRQFIYKTKPSLFSKPSLPIIGKEEEEDSTVLMVPAEDCVIKLGLFGQEVFPHAKWPEHTYPQ